MKALVGLGNPGPRYSNTRHNLGFLVADALVRKQGTGFSPGKGDFYLARLRDFWVVKPTTFMNLSGVAVAQFLEIHHLEPGDILVVYDDASLVFGKIRLRLSGGSGGHRGMESVLYYLGTEDVPRLKLGVGPIPEGIRLEDFVLSEWAPGERALLPDLIDAALACVKTYREDPARAPGLCGQIPGPRPETSQDP